MFVILVMRILDVSIQKTGILDVLLEECNNTRIELLAKVFVVQAGRLAIKTAIDAALYRAPERRTKFIGDTRSQASSSLNIQTRVGNAFLIPRHRHLSQGGKRFLQHDLDEDDAEGE